MSPKNDKSSVETFIEKSEAYACGLGKGHTVSDKLNKELAALSQSLISEGRSSELTRIAYNGESQAASAWACMMLIQSELTDSDEKKRLAKQLRLLERQPGLMEMVIIGFLAQAKL